MATGGTHPLVERARSATRELEDLPGITAARDAADQMWRARPWLLGTSRRAQLAILEACLGATFAAPGDAGIDGATLRIKRGVTSRFSATRRDGTTEDHAMPPPGNQIDLRGLLGRVEAARGEHRDRQQALARITGAPAWAIGPLRGWRLLLAPLFWFRRRRYRTVLAERTAAEAAAVEARAELDRTEHAISESESRAKLGRSRYLEALRTLAGSPDVRDIDVEVGEGELPDGIELVEHTPERGVDAVVDLDRAALVAGGVRLGEVTAAIRELQALVASARALRVARHVRATAAMALDTLDERVDRAEDGFHARIEKLEAMRIGDRAGFRAVQLARLRPQIVGSVHAVIEHASVHLGTELAQLGNEWIGAIAGATSSDELKQVIAHIESTGAANAHRIADETRTLVSGGAAGSAHDLVPEILGVLQKHGLSNDYVRAKRAAPALPKIDLLPSLAQATDAKLSGSALANLFKSFDSRRTDVREKVHSRIEHLREVASAELLDVEPRLHAAIEAALDTALATALTDQTTWLDRAISDEHAAIAEARKSLAPLISQRDRARLELAELSASIAKFETAEPAAAAAAAS